jgi:hypothetical protein
MAFFAPQGMDDLFDGAAAEVFGVKTVLLPQPLSTAYKSRSFVKTGSGQT